MRTNLFGSLGCAFALTMAACGGAGSDKRGESLSGGISSADDTGTGGESDDADGAGVKLDVLADSTEDGEEHEECAAHVEEAESMLEPADVIIIVDNSGSMSQEAAEVREHLNGFSQQIIASGVDVRVVLISSYPGNGHGICIDPPLGSGGCPAMDNNPPLFTHLDVRVGSRNGLTLLMDNHASWAPVIRPEASLHIMMVSDDDSNIDAQTFDDAFKALDPSYADYKLHGIVCLQNCPEAARIGEVYIELGAMTDGVLGDLCDQDFQPIFDLLATEVIAGSQLGCEWEIPAPPEGEELDPDKVNVEFDDGSGGDPISIGRVDSPADCPNVVDGWYYDDPANPTMIIACPQTCDKLQGAMSAKINISMGCATIPAG
jgi:hypothetical protein